MDLLWNSLRRGWSRKLPSTKPHGGRQVGLGSTYCTSYHRLVTGDQEIFCDDLNYQVECDPGGEEEGRREDGPLTPDSGTFCPSDYGEGESSQGQSKIKKSTSLQFPSSSNPKEEDLEEEEEDYDWDDESLTCNVCDRSFETPRQLERHQLKKRHWGCSACDTLFNSLMDLEHHKEALGHWSDDDDDDEEEDDDDNDDESDIDYDYYFGYGVRGTDESECSCGCSGREPQTEEEEEEEETEFGPDKEEMEMLL